MQWDHFGQSSTNAQKYVNIGAQDKAARMKNTVAQINKVSAMANQMQESVDAKIIKKTKNTTLVEVARQNMQIHNEQASDKSQGGQEMKEVKGKMYLVHKLEDSDSIPRLTIMYNVTDRVIRAANGLPNDLMHHLTQILIPINDQNAKKYARKEKTEEQAIEDEKRRRDQIQLLMNSYICDVWRRPGADFNAEATYYCEDNNYDFQAAKKHFEEDRAFEEEEKRNIGKKKGGYTKLHQD